MFAALDYHFDIQLSTVGYTYGLSIINLITKTIFHKYLLSPKPYIKPKPYFRYLFYLVNLFSYLFYSF